MSDSDLQHLATILEKYVQTVTNQYVSVPTFVLLVWDTFGLQNPLSTFDCFDVSFQKRIG